MVWWKKVKKFKDYVNRDNCRNDNMSYCCIRVDAEYFATLSTGQERSNKYNRIRFKKLDNLKPIRRPSKTRLGKKSSLAPNHIAEGRRTKCPWCRQCKKEPETSNSLLCDCNAVTCRRFNFFGKAYIAQSELGYVDFSLYLIYFFGSFKIN